MLKKSYFEPKISFLSVLVCLTFKLTRSLKADDPPFMASTMDVVALMKEQRRMACRKTNLYFLSHQDIFILLNCQVQFRLES
jgi:hypothetical protein